MFMVVVMEACPICFWMNFMFSPIAMRMVAYVCLRLLKHMSLKPALSRVGLNTLSVRFPPLVLLQV